MAIGRAGHHFDTQDRNAGCLLMWRIRDIGMSTFAYDLLGDRLSATDPTGATSTATFDYLGREATTTAVVRQDAAS